MDTPRRDPLDRLRGRLVVSCQAAAPSPMRDSRVIVALARAAVAGGAAGLRLEGLDDVAAVRPLTGLPLIGLVKEAAAGSEVYITPRRAHVEALCRLGADIVAFDATNRPRPEPVAALVAAAHAGGGGVMADISTLDEARAALDAGADIVGTTLAGYTAHSPRGDGPDYALMEALARAGLPFIAEGRVRSPAEAAGCLERGALAVVVGTAITRPDVVTGWYVEALARARHRR